MTAVIIKGLIVNRVYRKPGWTQTCESRFVTLGLLTPPKVRNTEACHGIYRYTYIMKRKRNIVDVFKRARSKYWRYKRLLFPSPAELRFIELFGGKYFTFNWAMLSSTGFHLTFIYKQPPFFKREDLKREVRIGKYWADFGVRTPYYKRCIEIDGEPYHMDVVAEQDRDIYTYGYGWKTLRIRAWRVYSDTQRVQEEVIDFLTK